MFHKKFRNEIGHEIEMAVMQNAQKVVTIQIDGPDSRSENIITETEANELLDGLHAVLRAKKRLVLVNGRECWIELPDLNRVEIIALAGAEPDARVIVEGVGQDGADRLLPTDDERVSLTQPLRVRTDPDPMWAK